MRQHEYWNEHAGEGWAENADELEALNGPTGDHALRAADVRPGEVVLDAGCGTGATSFALAQAVGPAGRVTGIDLSAPMIRTAVKRRDDLGLDQVTFVEDDIETTALAPATIDLVFSRMCLMLLDDVRAGLANLRQALKPGGRLVATAFRGASDNPWLPLVVMGAAPFIDGLPLLPLPGEPGPFRFASADVPRTLLSEAGFAGVTVTPVDTRITVPGAPEEAAALLIQLGPAGGPYRAASTENQQQARSSVLSLLRPFTDDHGRITVPSATWTIAAHRPLDQGTLGPR